MTGPGFDLLLEEFGNIWKVEALPHAFSCMYSGYCIEGNLKTKADIWIIFYLYLDTYGKEIFLKRCTVTNVFLSVLG